MNLKKIMSDVKKGENNPNYGKKVEGSGKPSQVIEVSDIKNNTTTSYDSIHEVARALNINQYRIYIKQSSMPLLQDIVSPHFHFSMLYKIGK